jgi:hypothetical protein
MERPAEKERPAESAPEVEPRDGVIVGASPTRCPFCHAAVAVDSEPWVACSGCLGRHHRECWDEGGKCAGCGVTASLGRVGAVAGGATQEAPTPRRRPDAPLSDPRDHAPRRVLVERSLGHEIPEVALADMVRAAQRALSSTAPHVTEGRGLTWSSAARRQVHLRIRRADGRTTLSLEEDLTSYRSRLRVLTFGLTLLAGAGVIRAVAEVAPRTPFPLLLPIIFGLAFFARRVYVRLVRRRRPQLEELATNLMRIGGEAPRP